MYLLASRSGILTGRMLASTLKLRFHTNVEHIYKPISVLIRYGNSSWTDNIRGDTDVNSSEAIFKMSNKKRLSEFLEDSNIIVPKYYPYMKSDPIPEGLTFPVLSRHFFHRGGLDITICNSEKDIPWNVQALVPYYPTSREYRAHVVFGNVVKVMRKVPNNELTAHPIIRSSYYGWNYRLADLDQVICADSLVDTAVKAAQKIGATFCGIDVAWSKELKKWIVWEMNSAPSLNESSLAIYKDLIIKHFQEKYGSKHDLHKPA